MDSMLELGWAPPAAEEDEVDMKAILEQADQERRQSLELVAVPRKASRRSNVRHRYVLRRTERSSNNPAGLPQVYEADRSQGWPGGEAGRRGAGLTLNPHHSPGYCPDRCAAQDKAATPHSSSSSPLPGYSSSYYSMLCLTTRQCCRPTLTIAIHCLVTASLSIVSPGLC